MAIDMRQNTSSAKEKVNVFNLVTCHMANMPHSATLAIKSNLPHVSHGNIAADEPMPRTYQCTALQKDKPLRDLLH